MAPDDVVHVGVIAVVVSGYLVLAGLRSASFLAYAIGCVGVFVGIAMTFWNV
jgi:hypothetical protein